MNCDLDIWSKYQHVILQRSVSNSSVRTEKSRLKHLLIKSLKIVSMAFGVSLIAFGGYSLGCIFFLIIFPHVQLYLFLTFRIEYIILIKTIK